MKSNNQNVWAAVALSGLLSLAACKKETVETVNTDTNGDTTTVVKTTTTGVSPDIEMDSAKVRWERAKQKVKEAVAKGDKKAEAAAQKTADEAEAAWNSLKADVKEGTDKTKAALEEAKEDTKEKYNETLEKAKAK